MSQNNQLALPQEVTKAIESAQTPFTKIIANHPGFVHWEDEVMFAMQAVSKNSLLQKCEPSSIRDSVINIAAIGLSLNPKLGHCALIPRYNNNTRMMECHADPMYKGLLKIATDGGNVINVWCGIVYRSEEEAGRFNYKLGTNPSIDHEPRDGDDHSIENAIAVYCCAEVRDSNYPKIELIWRETVLEIMESSDMVKKARKEKKPIKGPWADRPEEMWKKTALKRAQKTWPKGTGRLETAIHYANIAEGYIEPKPDDIPGEAEPVVVKTVSDEQAKELRSQCRSIGMAVDKVYKAFDIQKMEDLPIEHYESVKQRIQTAGLINRLRHATKEDEIYAEDFGMTLKQLEGFGAETQTEARLFSKRV